MVEYSLNLNNIFYSLSDPTRRDILKRISKKSLSVSEIAKNYNLTFAAISKHLKVLEKAKLVSKKRRGKEQIVQLSPKTFRGAEHYLRNYEHLWTERLEKLDQLLK